MNVVGNMDRAPNGTVVRRFTGIPLFGLYLTLGLLGVSLLMAVAFPKGFTLAVFGDVLQVALLAAATGLALQNALRSHAQLRIFWLLLFFAAGMWLTSLVLWSVYELGLGKLTPDLPVGDILLFLKIVPISAAAALQPQKKQDSRIRAFGLQDLAILILYSLYLFAFFVYAYRLLPGAADIYNLNFNIADAIGNQLFAVIAGVAFLRERGPWRSFYGILFFVAASYAVGSNLSNAAIDLGQYYTGSLYDLPLTAAVSGFVWLCLAGRSLLAAEPVAVAAEKQWAKPTWRYRFLASHLTMLVTISTPAIGLWLLTSRSASGPLFSFRLDITLLTIFFLSLLLSIKQDVLSAYLIGSLQHLSSTYSSIDRFKDHLVQNEKLATLGELVASVANQIGDAMTRIREQAARITSHAGADSRTGNLAAKIGQYAERTDALAENMQRFAQETPLQLAPVEVKPLLESALHLSRISKLPNLRIELREEAPCPPVLADSSQLLHVFLQIISNAMDALEEVGGGELGIAIRPCDPNVSIHFSDTGPGLKYPEHVFEPFFTTKPVGKGTGLGLSTCYGIIRQHDGDISCGNRREGGVHVRIVLPAVLPAASARQEALAAPAVAEGAT
jgi:signal transduction histidine kinase